MIGHAGSLAQLPADDAPVEVGEAEVEQHEIAGVGSEGSGARADQVDLEALAPEARPQRLGDRGDRPLRPARRMVTCSHGNAGLCQTRTLRHQT